jgi:peptidoglycan/LPS O-acetylase OafA/YrhL
LKSAGGSDSLPYRPDIDGLRAIAVIAVVLFHAFPALLPGGFVGVDIFFVISGFLITGLILKEAQNGRFSVVNFYSRRIARIFPALALVLAATLGCG